MRKFGDFKGEIIVKEGFDEPIDELYDSMLFPNSPEQRLKDFFQKASHGESVVDEFLEDRKSED